MIYINVYIRTGTWWNGVFCKSICIGFKILGYYALLCYDAVVLC